MPASEIMSAVRKKKTNAERLLNSYSLSSAREPYGVLTIMYLFILRT